MAGTGDFVPHDDGSFDLKKLLKKLSDNIEDLTEELHDLSMSRAGDVSRSQSRTSKA